MARVIANRLRPWLVDLLQSRQHCSVQGNTVLEAIATVKEAVVYVEINNALCILSLDFKVTFDNISHSYLFTMLKACGFTEGFQQRIKAMNEVATSSMQISGRITNPTPIRYSIRQGCPLSMQFFAICLNPLICILDERLPGTQTGRRNKETNVLAYADVTIIVTSPADIQPIREAMRRYQAAS